MSKRNYKPTKAIVTVRSATTLYVFLPNATQVTSPIVAPANFTPTTSTLQQISVAPPQPSTGEWYGLHFIVLDPSTRALSTTPVTATIYGLKSV
ncbi:MAG: hypothetical protein RMI04_09705, partial [Thermofilaceae archaeon]|nr:hypothetical protein [Thermofilaceae archaeon]